MYPKYGIVRKPSKNFLKCITSHSLSQSIDVNKAKEQHANYCNILEELGIELIHLPVADDYPDSCFVEDNVIIYHNKALMTRMGVESRRGEIDSVADVLKEFKIVKRTESPATIEGGDVIHTPNHLICGISQRTNQEGVEQMANWLNIRVETCIDANITHLKSHVTYLGNNKILSTINYAKHPVFDDFEKIFVPIDEVYSANSLTIGNTVLIPQGYPKTKQQLESHGYEVITLNMSEFEKCEGGLTCLSILFK